MIVRRFLLGVLVLALGAVVAVVPADAAKPKPGNWFSDAVDPEDEGNLSSVQFKVKKSGKSLKQVTIFWRCRNKSGYHNFSNPPFPIGINKKGKFKLVGATTPPSGQSSKDFTLKGKFVTKKTARYTMELGGCGPRVSGKIRYAD